jgi:hypothetical protein
VPSGAVLTHSSVLGGLIRWLLFAAGDRQAAAVDAAGLRGAEFPEILGVQPNPHARRRCELLPLRNFTRNYAGCLLLF